MSNCFGPCFCYLGQVTATDIRQMTVLDKLRLMEALWQDLSADEAGVPSPAWHNRVLEERVRLVESGQETFMDWDAAKKLLRGELQ